MNFKLGALLRAAALTIPFVSAPAMAGDLVNVGAVGNSGDVGFYLAEAKGYFAAENLDVKLNVFDSAAKMIAPLGTGDLDVGSGAASAGLYNAAARKIDIRAVADRGRTAPGYQYQTLMIRKDLIDSGRVKGYADLKGLKIAAAAPGVTSLSVINEAMKKGGHAFADAETVFLGFPSQVVAFQTKAIDASMMVEPFGTKLVNDGTAVRWVSTEDFYPNDQISMIFYGDKFAKDKPDVARRFMKAYVRGVRDYNDALENGQWAKNAKADEVIAILSKNLGMKVEQLRGIFPHACNEDGRLDLDSMKKDLAFFKEQGLVGDMGASVDKIVDMSFVEAAVKELGPYKPAK
ncbi:MAG: transporter substrate-binding protein [Hyphomicrobiales bacterium]|nr:transporter substrate-binding protein [Hyphomicrobiales bacterium]